MEFLRVSLSPSQYRAMLPPLGDLLGLYKVDPEIAFALYRPVLSHVTPPLLAPPPEEGEIAATPTPAPAPGECTSPASHERCIRAQFSSLP